MQPKSLTYNTDTTNANGIIPHGGKKGAAAPEQLAKLQLDQIQTWITENYHIQYNAVKLENEIVDIQTGTRAPDDERGINSIYFRMTREGFKISPGLISRLINSDSFHTYHPFKDYFSNLPPWDGNDYLAQLAHTITVKEQTFTALGKTYSTRQLWPLWFKRWMVGVCAGAVGEGINTVCLVLIGRQGEKKTTWLRALVPPGLENYSICQHINPSTYDITTQNFLCESIIINLDDMLTSLNTRDYSIIKNLISIPEIINRKMHRKTDKRRPRTASFCASVNDGKFITDDYNRRYLPFEVEVIRQTSEIPMQQVWAQAYHMHNIEKTQFWFTKAEEEIINSLSNIYRMPSMEDQYLSQTFRPATGEDFTPGDKVHWLQHGEILKILQKQTPIMLKPKALSQALKAQNFTDEMHHRPDRGFGVICYPVVKIVPDQV